jgi:hypothetical protein
VGKAVMEASGGYEREWRNVLHNAGIEVRIVDPRRVRSFALLFERGTRVGNTDFGKNERGIYFVAGLDGWNRVERA